MFDFEGYGRALASKDVEAVLGYVADDVAAEDASTGVMARGREEVRSAMRTWLPLFERIELEWLHKVQSGHDIAGLARVRGRMGADVPLPGGRSLRVRGRSFDAHVGVFGRVDADGRLTRMVRIRDALVLARQLGVPGEDLERLMAGAPERAA